MKKLFKKSKGMAIITVLLLTTLLVLMTVSMVLISINHIATMGGVEARAKALKAAEAGVEYAIKMLNHDPSWGIKGLSLDPDPNNNTYSVDPNTDETIPYAEDCKFKITFNPTSPYCSINNLFETDPNKALISGTPCYTAKIISVGECGTTKKILEVYLVRSDFSAYNVSSDGILVFKNTNMLNFHGTDPNSPGYVSSNWNGLGDSIRVDTAAYEAPCPAGNPFVTNGGILSARGTIKLDPNQPFDGTLLPNLPKKTSGPIMEVDKIIDRLVGEGNKAGTLQTVGMGTVELQEVLPAITGPGEYDSTVTLVSSASDFDKALSITDNSGKTTLNLTKDVYIQGDPPSAGDEDQDYKNLIGHSNVLQMKVDPDALTAKHYVVTADANTGELTQTVYTVARDISFDPGGHSMIADSHVIIGMDVEGNGKMMAKGKIAYSQGTNSTDNSLITVSGEDLTVEVSDRSSGTYGKGLYYAVNKVQIKPQSGDSSLRVDGSENEPRDVQKHGDGKYLDSSGVAAKMTLGNNGACVDKTQITDPSGTTTTSLIIAGQKNTDGTNSPLQVDFTNTESDGSGGCVCCHDAANDGGREHVNVDFQDYKIAVNLIPDSSAPGGYVYGGTQLLDKNNLPVIVDDTFTAIDIKNRELDRIGNIFANNFLDPLSAKEIKMQAQIASSTNGKPNENSINAGTDYRSGSVELGLFPDYMKSMVYIQGTNFTVRKVSYRELK